MTVKQSTNAVLMIRPSRFYPNPETAADNAFQRPIEATDLERISGQARDEFDHAVEALREAGVVVRVFEDTPILEKPDAIFPNNWFSTHHDGRVALYPMYSPIRRRERRMDIIEELRSMYQITKLVDYSEYEKRDLYLEGTGSLVLDHVQRVAYVALSKRAQREPLQEFCADFQFEPLTFESRDESNQPIYHTNVMMCLGTDFALVGLELIVDQTERGQVQSRLETTGKAIITLDRSQVANFAGNALELEGGQEKILVLSSRAAASLSRKQQAMIERYARLLPLALPAIELAGGSARCMMAEIHLPPR